MSLIADYKIDIQYNRIINIDTFSGCDEFIANIAFKLAIDTITI